MKLILSSKAKTLQDLKPVIKNAEVLPLLRFYAKDYSEKKDSILEQCLKQFSTVLIVRSSSANEDNEVTSNAGGFDSILNVELNKSDIDNAILKVISSYEILDDKDEVFIQPMLKNVTMSGVIFTSDIDTFAPYYIINYDLSGSTSSVTSGDGKDLKTFIAYKYSNENKIENKKLQLLLKASKECEEAFNNSFLDIEFAYSNDILYILQVRAIVTNNKKNFSNIEFDEPLNKVFKKINKLNDPHPNLLGAKTIFAVMPDWNPAEIIGIKPKKLALSLYKELITNEIWAYQRDNYGYRNLRSHPLLVDFMGVPYIDVRVSFNSFIPKTLNDIVARKLVNTYISKLENDRNKHDKIEFDIVYSCYFFGIDKKLEELSSFGFNKDEIKDIKFSLLQLTNNIINPNSGLYKKDLEKIEILKYKFGSINVSKLSLIDKIYWLIEDCKRYGTLPFAGIARAAFIAVQFMNSLVDEKILTDKEYHSFLNSLNTISKQLSVDKNILTKERFIQRYGHLRPGTYDIESIRYDENYDFYFSSMKNTEDIEEEEFSFSDIQIEKISKLLKENGLTVTFDEFITFVKESIEGREYSKFIFTKHLSQILKYIEQFTNKAGISKEDSAYIDIYLFKKMYSSVEFMDVKNIFEDEIKRNKTNHIYTQVIKLPSIIPQASDIYSFYMESNEANFVTLKTFKGTIVDEEDVDQINLENKIVCIRSADPGYDYLFTKNIGALITCYGGANSHMAIRCAELGIPAVIGCGENSFNQYSKSNVIEINAENKQVKIIS